MDGVTWKKPCLFIPSYPRPSPVVSSFPAPRLEGLHLFSNHLFPLARSFWVMPLNMAFCPCDAQALPSFKMGRWQLEGRHSSCSLENGFTPFMQLVPCAYFFWGSFHRANKLEHCVASRPSLVSSTWAHGTDMGPLSSAGDRKEKNSLVCNDVHVMRSRYWEWYFKLPPLCFKVGVYSFLCKSLCGRIHCHTVAGERSFQVCFGKGKKKSGMQSQAVLLRKPARECSWSTVPETLPPLGPGRLVLWKRPRSISIRSRERTQRTWDLWCLLHS